MALKIIRRELDKTLSIYNGDKHLGLVFCRVAGGRTDYEAMDDTDELPAKTFDNEADAIAYLASA
jgi:hypothetical protein